MVHDEIYGERLRVLKGLESERRLGCSRARLESRHQASRVCLQPVPGRDALAEATREIRVGGALDEQEFTKWLVARGGHATTAVELPGEFSLRGGILDIFPPDAEDPVRIELFGSDVESIRRFDVATQRSLGSLEAVE